MASPRICVTFICNTDYFKKFVDTYNELITNGQWNGDVCLIVCDRLYISPKLAEFTRKHPITVKYFSPIRFPAEFTESQTSLNRKANWNKKMFQFNKLHLFNAFFKKWDYVFYVDCGIRIFHNIQPILDCAEPGKILAHSDAYPFYKNKLSSQFDKTKHPYAVLDSKYNLEVDYPQTTIMLYDTSIIRFGTFEDMYNLCIKYPVSITNDQGIIALYFTCIRSLWSQLPTENDTHCFYDYVERKQKRKPYIMLKNTHTYDTTGHYVMPVYRPKQLKSTNNTNDGIYI